ncbi:MAG: DUF4150 domain-containing protein [Sandaracinaceae bacterium]|nr:DUF4150 domain-containing protein [Sandaracinaceae bacterium]
MGYASTTEGGLAFAFPNTCNTPSPTGTIPITYPSIGDVSSTDTDTCSSKVRISNKYVCTTDSEIGSTNGDEAGSSGGVVSGMQGDVCAWSSGSSKVNVEGNAIARHLDPTDMNGDSANAYGAQLSPSQTKVSVDQ